MSDDERDAFLKKERTCRVATMSPDGPHATPLWFVWDGAALWLYSIVKSQRWTDLMRDPRIGVVIDAGEDFLELRGVEIAGSVEVVGDVPRIDTQNADLAPIESAFGEKYAAGQFGHDERHAWLRVTPSKISSWDFRKIAG